MPSPYSIKLYQHLISLIGVHQHYFNKGVGVQLEIARDRGTIKHKGGCVLFLVQYLPYESDSTGKLLTGYTVDI